MNFATLTRRSLLKVALVLGAATLCGINLGSKAYASGRKLLKSYMSDRLSMVYYADMTMPVRASQDNEQVKTLYRDFLGEPGGELAHKYLHMHFTDRSQAVEALRSAGKLENPGAERFKDAIYPFEWVARWFSKG